jgi:hypothetical protein
MGVFNTSQGELLESVAFLVDRTPIGFTHPILRLISGSAVQEGR